MVHDVLIVINIFLIANLASIILSREHYMASQ
jgi:hypothetical protein